MKIRAVLIDMDGTLLGASQVAVSARNMSALQKCISKGVHVIPCTGRVYNMLPPQILTQEGLRYFVTSHGARAYDKQTGNSLYENLIPPEEALKLFAILEGRGLYNEVAADKTIFFEKSVSDKFPSGAVPEHHIWYVRDRCYNAVEKMSDYFSRHHLGVEKMNLYGIPQKYQQEIYDLVSDTGFVKHTRPGAGPHLEFAHCSIDKLKATDAVLKKLGISYEETLAIGDSSSDVQIIQRAGLGVAMGNAPDDVKAEADEVTAANVDDGVALTLEKYIV